MPNIIAHLAVTGVTSTELDNGETHETVQLAGHVDLPAGGQSPLFAFSVYRPQNVNTQPGDMFTLTLTKV
jgi:hypothetical protein